MLIVFYYYEEDGKWYCYVYIIFEDVINVVEELGCKVMIFWGYGNLSW